MDAAKWNRDEQPIVPLKKVEVIDEINDTLDELTTAEAHAMFSRLTLAQLLRLQVALHRKAMLS